jgi:hypothetical protein
MLRCHAFLDWIPPDMIRHLPKLLFLAAVGGILAFGIGEELANRPRPMEVPPGATLISFGDLAGTRLPDPGRHPGPGDYRKGVPRAILDLDQRRVAIQGFMVPTRTGPRGVEAFLLVRSQASCCFGIPPTLADVLEVHMAGNPVDPLQDRVVNVVGRLRVQESWAGPLLGSLYQLEAESVVPGSPLGAKPLARAAQAMGME